MIRTIAELFVRPADRRPARVEPRPPGVAAGLAIAVVCAANDAQSVGAAVALTVARSRRARCALVTTWLGAPCPPIELVAPPVSASRRLAASLVGRGIDSRAAGRLVHAPLPVAESEAAATARRAIAAAHGVPTVLVVGGPRTDALGELLGECHLVVVATPRGSEPLLAELACAAMPLPASAVVACTPALGLAGRALSGAGIGVVPSLRAALRPVVEAVA